MDVKSYWIGISLEIMQIRRKCVMKLDYIKLPALYDTLPHVMAVVIFQWLPNQIPRSLCVGMMVLESLWLGGFYYFMALESFWHGGLYDGT